MKKTYESPEFECLKFSFEATLQNIQYSKNEDFQQQEQFPSQFLQHDFFPPERKTYLAASTKATQTAAKRRKDIRFITMLCYKL